MRNDIKSFTFYDNYFDLLDSLKREDKLILLEAIVDYVFKDVEPELEGLNKAIWNNIKMPINTSKIRANIGKIKKKSKRVSKQNQKEIKTKSKGVTNNISIFLFLISYFKELDRGLLRGKIEEWLKYKDERNEPYKETGMKSLLTQIKNNVQKYGEENVIEVINSSMASGYKGIIFEKLKNTKKKEKIPEWVGKEIETTTDEGKQKELEELLEEYKK